MAEKPDHRPCRCDWFLIGITILTGIIMFAAILGQIAIAGPGWLDNMRAWQTAISALVGFTGLIVTTWLGFYFSIRQRKEDARRARESREHQAELDRASQEYEAKLKRDQAARDCEDRAIQLAARLHAEMLANVMVAKHLLKTLEKHFGDPTRFPLDTDYEAAKAVWALDFPVYTACLSDLDHLGAEIDSDVALTVRQARRQVMITLHNLYVGNTQAGDGEKAISGIKTINTEMRNAAERLRVRAGLPPDENSEVVKQLAKN